MRVNHKDTEGTEKTRCQVFSVPFFNPIASKPEDGVLGTQADGNYELSDVLSSDYEGVAAAAVACCAVRMRHADWRAFDLLPDL